MVTNVQLLIGFTADLLPLSAFSRQDHKLNFPPPPTGVSYYKHFRKRKKDRGISTPLKSQPFLMGKVDESYWIQMLQIFHQWNNCKFI